MSIRVVPARPGLGGGRWLRAGHRISSIAVLPPEVHGGAERAREGTQKVQQDQRSRSLKGDRLNRLPPRGRPKRGLAQNQAQSAEADRARILHKLVRVLVPVRVRGGAARVLVLVRMLTL